MLLKKPLVIAFSSIVVLTTLALSWHFRSFIDLSALTMAELGPAGFHPQWIYRLLVLGTGFLLSFSMMSLIPSRKTTISYIGKYSVYPYCIHTFLLPVLFFVVDRQQFQIFNGPVGYCVFLLACVATTALLASKPARVVFRPFVEPRVDWSFLLEKPKS